jgi:hypothetical protein
MKGFQPNLRNLLILQLTCSCIVELREEVTLSRIFPKLRFFVDFSEERSSVTAIDGKSAQRPFLRVKGARIRRLLVIYSTV